MVSKINTLTNTDLQLKISHWNCNSLNNKLEIFNIFIKTFQPLIVSLNETKMCLDSYLSTSFSNYFFIHKHRKLQNGAGGVGLLINKQLKFTQNYDFDDLNCEILAINININNKNIIILSYYNPPSSNVSNLSSEVFQRLLNKHFILLGDLNAKSNLIGCRGETSSGLKLLEILDSEEIILLNDGSHTYFNFNEKNSDILDLAICSRSLHLNYDYFYTMSEWGMGSDHVPITVQFSFKKNSFEKTIDSLNFNYNKADWDLFKRLLPHHIPDSVKSDLDEFYNWICTELLCAAKRAIPARKFKHTGSAIPDYLIDLVKVRQCARKEKNKKDEARKLYNLMTKIVQGEMKAHKNNSWENFLKSIGPNPLSSKPIWNRINKLRNKKTKSSIPTLYWENKYYESDEEKANLFGSILNKVFSDSEDTRFDEQHKIQVENEVKNLKSDDDSLNSSSQISLSELNNIIKNLKLSSAPGEDKIDNKLIFHAPFHFRKILLSFINLSINKSYIPDPCKRATITMIPKKISKSNNPKEYRPISLTSSLAKLCEKAIALKLKVWMKDERILIKQQSGFRAHRQTKDNILFISQKVIDSFNRVKKVCAIFFDIASAFDKVWHDGLIYKLHKIRCPVFIVKWIKDFLKDRSFRVQINESMSDFYDIKAGVPQGAVLSPLLFSIYINDLPSCHSRHKSYYLLFADDLASFFIYKKPKRPSLLLNDIYLISRSGLFNGDL